MAESTKIQWAHSTFNPWVGCEKVSPACDHCYAEGWAKRTGQSELWNGARRRTSEAYWRGPEKWNRAASVEGKHWRVFCASLADVFDDVVPGEWRADLWGLIARTPWLTWMLLTKRPQNIARMLPLSWYHGRRTWSCQHVWIGTTVENQTEADRRIPDLATVPAAVRFLSCEPLLEPIRPDLRGIGWVICGGESGPGAREMDPAWARALRDQCAAEGVPFFMKQMSRRASIPDDLMVREFPLMVREFPA